MNSFAIDDKFFRESSEERNFLLKLGGRNNLDLKLTVHLSRADKSSPPFSFRNRHSINILGFVGDTSNHFVFSRGFSINSCQFPKRKAAGATADVNDSIIIDHTCNKFEQNQQFFKLARVKTCNL